MRIRLPWRRPKSVTLPIWRNATITLPEPAWCDGHQGAVPEHPADVRHEGLEVPLIVHAEGRTFELLGFTVVQEPYSAGDSLPHGSVDLGDDYARCTYGELLAIADGLVAHASRLREFADDVEQLRDALDAEGDD